MKIKEIFLDAINRTRLFEMAHSRKDALSKLMNYQHQVSVHLIKVLMYSNSTSTTHWCSEINSWLNVIDDIELKPSMKRLDYDTLKKYLWEHYLETIAEVQRIMNKVYRTYTIPPKEPDAALVHKRAEEIMESVCRDLSNGSFTKIEDYINVVQ